MWQSSVRAAVPVARSVSALGHGLWPAHSGTGPPKAALSAHVSAIVERMLHHTQLSSRCRSSFPAKSARSRPPFSARAGRPCARGAAVLGVVFAHVLHEGAVSRAALWCLGAVRADWRVEWGRRGLPEASRRTRPLVGNQGLQAWRPARCRAKK